MAGVTHERRIPRRRARCLERAARHLLAAYQRTYDDRGVWEVEADELHLDYVIALEALLISPNDPREGIAENICSRASVLFLTRDDRERAKAMVQQAYKARSTYVHGDVIRDPDRGREAGGTAHPPSAHPPGRPALARPDPGRYRRPRAPARCQRPGHGPRTTRRWSPARLLHQHSATQDPVRRHRLLTSPRTAGQSPRVVDAERQEAGEVPVAPYTRTGVRRRLRGSLTAMSAVRGPLLGKAAPARQRVRCAPHSSASG